VAEFALLFRPALTAAPFGARRPMIERYSDHAANERTFLPGCGSQIVGDTAGLLLIVLGA
jgi:hypothetical protein